LVAVAAAPLFAWFLPLLWAPGEESVGDARMAVFALFLAALVWVKHHANIRRLLGGTEPKIGKSKKESGTPG
jgi:glycerol-3-phosphate acyltransferase PlsY